LKYLGSIVQKNKDIVRDGNHRILAGWLKWRRVSSVLSDSEVPLKLKEKFYCKIDDVVWDGVLDGKEPTRIK